MDTAITLSFFCLSIFSFITYIKSQGHVLIRLLKGVAIFFFSILSIGSYSSGDQIATLIILLITIGLTFRRYRLTKSFKLPAPAPAPTEFKATQSAATKKFKKPQTDYSKSKSLLEYIAFSYTDSNGSSTYREVDVKKVDEDYITGYCHTRRKLRTFRIDRVTDNEVVVRDSGEVLNVYDWIVLLYK